MNYTRWVMTEIFFTLSVFSAVLFGIYAMSVKLNNGLSDSQLTILSGIFFIVFAISQLFSGVLINKISPKVLLGSSALVAAFGAFIFANSHEFIWLMLARVLLGLGLGCTFVGVLYIVQISFNQRQFPFFSSFSQSIANIFTGILALIAGNSLSQYGYNIAYNILGGLFIFSAITLAILLPHNHNKQTTNINVAFFSSLKQILKKRNFWLACFYFTGLFGAILTFTDLFNVTYQVSIFQVPRTTAIMLNGMTPLGVAAGGIVAGLLVSKFQKNQLTASIFSFISLIAMFIILYVRIPHEASYLPWFIIDFIFGFGCGGAMLAFQEIQILLKDAVLRPLANSIILTFAYLFNGLILQPLTGYIIGSTEINHSAYYSQAELYFVWLYDTKIHDTWHKFNNGLTVIILMLVICFISSFFFSKTNKK